MEAKWPFLLLLLFFVGLTGYLISQLERTKVMRHWDKRRCDFTVMLAARFFKPETDPRTPDAFSADNFDFCVKEYSDGFLSILMAPISWLMGKQATLAGGAMNVMNQVREITKRVTDAFMSYLSSYMKKVNASMFELRRIVIHLRTGVQRMLAIAMSTIYMGMTLFRGMISSIQTVIRVILIICAIMIAVIILLWFILLPVIPFILTTLTAVVALVGALSVVMSSSLASQAESQKGGFCFAEGTLLRVKRSGSTEEVTVPIKEVRLGDRLEDDSEVTMIMEVTSDHVEWYEVDGIWVSGDHRIQSETGKWWLVREDPRACPRDIPPPQTQRVYCLNTTTRHIPLRGATGILYRFRDWEELEEEDTCGHSQWREHVFRILNGSALPPHLDLPQDIPLVGKDVEVQTTTGWKHVSDVVVGEILLMPDGRTQRVLGVVRGCPSAALTAASLTAASLTGQWTQGGYMWDTVTHQWIPATAEGVPPEHATGWNLITETGEWTARTQTGVSRRRDFTEVGHQAIKGLYDMVDVRLRSSPLS
jgi:hypothetical protein